MPSMTFSMLLVLTSSASGLLQPPAFAPAAAGQRKPLIDKINFFRCEMCAHQCPDSGAMPKCIDFMRKMCNPGADGRIDGSPGERTTGHGWCTDFFNTLHESCLPKPNAKEEAPRVGGTSVETVAAPAPAPIAGHAGRQPRQIVAAPLHLDELNLDHLDEAHIEALSHLGAQEVFGTPGTLGYISRKEIDTMTSEEITEDEKKVQKHVPRSAPLVRSHLKLQGPLPFDFERMFAHAVVEAVPDCRPELVKIDQVDKYNNGVREIMWRAPQNVVDELMDQLIDPYSHIVNGEMRKYLIKPSHYQEHSIQERAWTMH